MIFWNFGRGFYFVWILGNLAENCGKLFLDFLPRILARKFAVIFAENLGGRV